MHAKLRRSALARGVAAVAIVAASSLVGVVVTAGDAFAFSPGVGSSGQTLLETPQAMIAYGIAALAEYLLPASWSSAGTPITFSSCSGVQCESLAGEGCSQIIKANDGFPPWFPNGSTTPQGYGEFTGDSLGLGTDYFGTNSGLDCDPVAVLPALYSAQQISQEPWQDEFCIMAQVYDGGGYWPPSSASSLSGTSWGWLTDSWAENHGPGYGGLDGTGVTLEWTSAQQALDYLNTACPPAWLQGLFGTGYTGHVAGMQQVAGSPTGNLVPDWSFEASDGGATGWTETAGGGATPGVIQGTTTSGALVGTQSLSWTPPTVPSGGWDWLTSPSFYLGVTNYSTSAYIYTSTSGCSANLDILEAGTWYILAPTVSIPANTWTNIGAGDAGYNGSGTTAQLGIRMDSAQCAGANLLVDGVTLIPGTVGWTATAPPTASPINTSTTPNPAPAAAPSPQVTPTQTLPAAPPATLQPEANTTDTGGGSWTDVFVENLSPILSGLSDLGNFLLSGIQWLAGQIWSALQSLGTAIVNAVSWLGNFLAPFLQAIASAVYSIGSQVVNAISSIASAIALQLQELFIPSSTAMQSTLSSLQIAWTPTPPGQALNFLPPLVAALPTSIPKAQPCGPVFTVPSVDIAGLWAGGTPSWSVPLPSPSPCPGTGPNGTRTTFDDDASSLFGYRTLVRGIGDFALVWWFVWSLVGWAPWSAKTRDMIPFEVASDMRGAQQFSRAF